MAKAKKAHLPKDFDALLAAGDLEALCAVFDSRDVNARHPGSKRAALAFEDCPDELARWLVAHGADIQAADAWGNTPLHFRARSRRSRIDVLLELGADIHAAGATIGTPLHAAADSRQVAHAATLLAHGAQVDARNGDGLTALELALRGCSNAQIEDMAKLAELLVQAGARRTPAAQRYLAEIGKRFEFFREAFAKDSVDAVSAALHSLYAIFEVTPVARRNVHDGTTAITVKSTRWQEQHAELWGLLVPASGQAVTVQGEVTRIAGRVSREILDNGGLNWDADFKRMTRAFLALVQTGTPLGEAELARIRTVVKELVARADGDAALLAELGVAWVLSNPNPVALGKIDYTR